LIVKDDRWSRSVPIESVVGILAKRAISRRLDPPQKDELKREILNSDPDDEPLTEQPVHEPIPLPPLVELDPLTLPEPSRSSRTLQNG